MRDHDISQRRACRLVGVDPKTVRRDQPPDNPEVREEMKAIASKRRRFGYRRIGVLLERKGMVMNHKKLYRLYTEEKLGVRRRRGRKRARGSRTRMPVTGIRVAALVSLRIKHINLTEKFVTQNPREVATKFGKSIDTFFAQGFEGAEAALTAWITYLDEVEFYGPDDPLLPATDLVANSNTGFTAQGFKRCPWKSTEPVRKIVRSAFERAGLPNYGPHAFRHMLARHAVNTSTSVAEFVANSQNLGHSDVLTTLRSYGQISRERQRGLVTGKSSEE